MSHESTASQVPAYNFIESRYDWTVIHESFSPFPRPMAGGSSHTEVPLPASHKA